MEYPLLLFGKKNSTMFGVAVIHNRNLPVVKGFTLVEVLVALAIVSVALGAGIKAAGSLITNAQRQEDVTLAQWCIENRMVAMTLERMMPTVENEEITCQQMGRSLKVKTQTQPTPNPVFKRVDLQVVDEKSQPVFSLATVVKIN